MPSKEDTLTQSHPVETIGLWNGAVVPRIGLGTWAAGGMMIWPSGPSSYGSVSRDDAIAGIRLAHDLGVRIFDTAAAYGAGNAELILGEALKDKDDAVIVAHTLARLADLNVTALCEGVETEAEFDTLREMGAHLFQGYYFGRPVFEGVGAWGVVSS